MSHLFPTACVWLNISKIHAQTLISQGETTNKWWELCTSHLKKLTEWASRVFKAVPVKCTDCEQQDMEPAVKLSTISQIVLDQTVPFIFKSVLIFF